MVSKIINIRYDMTGISSFNFPIDSLNFLPDEIVVRSVSFSADTAASAQTFSMYSDLVNDNLFIATVAADSAINVYPNIRWRTQNGNGLWNFRTLNVLGVATNRVGTFHIMIQLEFIKHG